VSKSGGVMTHPWMSRWSFDDFHVSSRTSPSVLLPSRSSLSAVRTRGALRVTVRHPRAARRVVREGHAAVARHAEAARGIRAPEIRAAHALGQRGDLAIERGKTDLAHAAFVIREIHALALADHWGLATSRSKFPVTSREFFPSMSITYRCVTW
jgi:hypothetical protein